MMIKEYKIGIIGLGYVGLPLSIAFAEKYQVVGYDINEERVSELNNGIDKTKEIEAAQFETNIPIQFTTDLNDISACNIYIVTVPTPIDKEKQPDLSFLINASNSVGSILKKGDIVIYESTVYPGCTEEECVPVLESSSGLKFNHDFYVGYSPERINPGDKTRPIQSIIKVTSGSTPEIARLVLMIYIKASLLRALI
jgi:UDP-N-acetyl-D-galactosamine dehydrogenase